MAKSKSTPRNPSKKKPGKKASPKAARKVSPKVVQPKKAVKKAARKATAPKKAAKKAAPKKKAAKKPPQTNDAGTALEVAPIVPSGAQGQKSIRFDVNFFSGVGDINFRGQNVSINHLSANNHFLANQDAGFQTVFVNGNVPAGKNGKIQVQVSEGGTVLSPFSANTFTGKTFNSAITYTVV